MARLKLIHGRMEFNGSRDSHCFANGSRVGGRWRKALLVILPVFFSFPLSANGDWSPLSALKRLFQDAKIERCVDDAVEFYQAGRLSSGFTTFDVWKINQKEKYENRAGIVVRLDITMEGILALRLKQAERRPPPRTYIERTFEPAKKALEGPGIPYKAADRRHADFGVPEPRANSMTGCTDNRYTLNTDSYACEEVYRMNVEFYCAYRSKDSQQPYTFHHQKRK